MVFHEEVPGGATLSVLRMLPALEERGWRFRIWAPDPSELADYLRDAGHVVRGAPRPIVYSLAAMRLPPGVRARLKGLPRYVREFRSTLAEVQPVLLHANSLFTLTEACLGRAAGVPVVFHVHEMRPGGWKGFAGAWGAGKVASELVAVSAASCTEFALGGTKPVIVYEGAIVPPEARPEPGGDQVIGTVGVISTRKGSDLFVEAARIIRTERPEVRFEMVGSPTDQLEEAWASEILDRAATVGVKHIERADVPERLRAWTAFALPSRRDPFPISMLEAMGHGLPVVGTAVDGIAEQLSGSAGVLVQPDDPVDLARALIGLLDDPDRRRELGARARDRVRGRYSVGRQAGELNEVYERILASSPRSA